MKSSIIPLKQYVFLYLFLNLIALLPFQLIAQKKEAVQSTSNSYGAASYHGINNGAFMRSWRIAGPLPVKENSTGTPTADAQEKFFNEERFSPAAIVPAKPLPLKEPGGKSFGWKNYTAREDTINFDSIFNKTDYAAGYALAEIKADSSYPVFLAVGSDGGIKVWHNGKLVHKNWVARALTPDEDVIPITLAKGSNQFLIKVQDMEQGWGFTARFLNKDGLSIRLVTASAMGNIDEINSLLKAGADIEKKDATGLTAINAARLSGRDDVVKLLLEKGASKTDLPVPELMTDQLYNSLNGKAAPGIAVLVAKDGKILYKKGFSYGEIENKTLVTPETKFRIGSITKQFTASAILKLQEDGLLQVRDKLSKYFPDFPRGNEVSLYHLLTHTSGIHSYTGKDDFIKRVASPITEDSLLDYFKNDPYDFNPGSEWRYNNSGYFLLGYIIEKVSGKSYGNYLKEKFFDPLQMNNTGVYSSSLKLENEAKGYTKSNNAFQRALNWDMSWAGGAGALYSTVEDLNKWNEGVFGGKVLNEKSLKAAFTPVELNGGTKPPGVNYGYGWGLGAYRGLQVTQHSGGLDGFISQLARYPGEKLTVVILTNSSSPDVNINPNKIAEFYLWEKMDKQRSYAAQTLPNQDLKIYEGRYDFSNGAVMTITSQGNDLFAQLSGQAKFQIFPSAENEFFWKVVEARIKFIKNEKGEVISGHFTQGGAEIDVPKLKDEAIVTVDTAIYKNYVGKYNYGDNMVISITTAGGKIFAQATNQQMLEMFPVSDKEFVLKELNARISFVKEPDGKISKMKVSLGGQAKDALKIE